MRPPMTWSQYFAAELPEFLPFWERAKQQWSKEKVLCGGDLSDLYEYRESLTEKQREWFDQQNQSFQLVFSRAVWLQRNQEVPAK